MTPALRDRVAEMLAAPRASQLSLYEEIALARVAAVEAARVAAPALQGERGQWRAVFALRDAIRHVADLVEAQSRVERADDGGMSRAAAHLLVEQVIAEVRSAAGDAVADEVRARLSAASAGAGSPLDSAELLRRAADELAAEMDAATLPPRPGPPGEEPGEVQGGVGGTSVGEDGAREAASGDGAP